MSTAYIEHFSWRIVNPQTKTAKINCLKNFALQWNPSIAATLGEQNFGCYIGVAFIEGLFCTQTVRLIPGFLAVIQRWSGVAVKRGSTVYSITTQQQVNDVRVILLQAEISAGAVANDLEVTRYYCKTALSYNGMDKFLKFLL